MEVDQGPYTRIMSSEKSLMDSQCTGLTRDEVKFHFGEDQQDFDFKKLLERAGARREFVDPQTQHRERFKEALENETTLKLIH